MKRNSNRWTKKPPPLVVLCDISGSMNPYSRMFLHFVHSLMSDRDRVHIFLFGTRLTNVTREITRRDVDEAGQPEDDDGGQRAAGRTHRGPRGRLFGQHRGLR